MPSHMFAPNRHHDSLQPALFWSLTIFLVLAWFGGGATVDVTATDEWIMLLALAPLVLASSTFLLGGPLPRRLHVALALALLVTLVPLLQLISLPEDIWLLSTYRVSVVEDLKAAGLTGESHPWTLWPEATTRAVFTLLPAVACFLGALALGHIRARGLVPVALGLVLANLAFGFFQAGLPPDSGMRLYADNGSGIGGVLVNGNHQGTALIVGMLLAMGLWARERRRDKELGHSHGMKSILYAAASMGCLAAVALTGSSGAMIIALVAAASAIFATGLLSVARIRRSRSGVAAAAAVLGVLILGLLSAKGWMNLEVTEPLRYQLAREAAALGFSHAPLGSGVGTFEDSYAQSASLLFQRGQYINHAHNEFAQWWFEAGWPGMIWLLAALVLLMTCGWQLLRWQRRDPVAIACWLAVVAVLAHSWVDFPLRTLSLASLTALLAGIVIGAVAAPSARKERAENALPPNKQA